MIATTTETAHLDEIGIVVQAGAVRNESRLKTR